ncbi:hypothetical protein BCV70DRAFT_201385 [Testicularia cyperi]|uniref:Sister chromatid cohesion protein Dcc1 n=1 Tax=Testicularia cyperi TaxID=1882483 RepID=A0A317XP51_9BASI|nr:hypothetical protein BCV70DRAFT_201385 [Testicularia cyperi]
MAPPTSTPSGSSSIRLCTVAQPLPQYHLLEIPSDLVPLFDATNSANKTTANADERDTDEKGPSKRRKLERLTIKGRYDDQAVLTTDTQTFALRSVSQSNSLLLCNIAADPSSTSSSSGSAPVLLLKSNVTDTLELHPVVPRLERLVGLLRASRYEGEDAVPQPGMRMYTLKQVRSIVQASPVELDRGMDQHHIVQLDGYVRQISPAHVEAILQATIAWLDLNAYLAERVPLRETLDALHSTHGLRRDVVSPVLSRFFGQPVKGDESKSKNTDSAKDADVDVVVSIDVEKVVKFMGVQQLRSTARIPTSLSQFLDAWQKACLSETFSSVATLSLLEGQHILHPAPTPTQNLYPSPSSVQIQYYSAAELPTEPAPRFQDLFLTRPSWLAQHLHPFIQDLALDAKKKDALLLKFCRSSKAKVLDWELTDQDKLRFNREKKLLGDDGKPKQVWREVTMYSARVKY